MNCWHLAEQRGMSVFKVYDNNLGTSVTFDFGRRIEQPNELVMFIWLTGQCLIAYTLVSQMHILIALFSSPDAFPPENQSLLLH